MLFSDRANGPAETIVAELRDYPEWRRGRTRYGIWMIPVEEPALLAYLRDARRRLADLLHPCPRRQPHLTLFVCGFESAARVADDDFTPAQLRRQIDLLGRDDGAAGALPLGRPDSFASAAFVPVGDPEGRLAGWRARLARAAREVRRAPYVPHITLGLYRRRVDAATVRARLAGLEAPPVPLPVGELHYATYEARVPQGALSSRCRLRLRGG
ncbi:2'-5' RNA ligase family protein [Fulvimonas soli]|jgi:hypothetical protein|uniref:2'-5' RNA ligase superfamily protein n=1 Tax=Fulvimonas soli TaxID=155197 RepID=A0A316IKQ4_9GAMM|nr:2'-5' RNA ligase family protein [Fulvimonas soli]PWK87772.1 2'-5' RNA ligase superfamily protein [Fulvimonas soli]TNY26515.1 hypothetical protein BV497_08210 [Fulvimonas soli]